MQKLILKIVSHISQPKIVEHFENNRENVCRISIENEFLYFFLNDERRLQKMERVVFSHLLLMIRFLFFCTSVRNDYATMLANILIGTSCMQISFVCRPQTNLILIKIIFCCDRNKLQLAIMITITTKRFMNHQIGQRTKLK